MFSSHLSMETMKHIHEIKDEILCQDDSSGLKRGFHCLLRTSFHGLEIQLKLSTTAFAVFKALENSV